MRSRLELQPLFMCGAMIVALCFLTLPALFLPGWETPTAKQSVALSVRGKFSIRNHLSAKHMQRLKRLFAKRKKGNASFQVPDALSSNEEDEAMIDEMFNKALAQHGARLTDILSVLDKSTIAQAQMFGLLSWSLRPAPASTTMADRHRMMKSSSDRSRSACSRCATSAAAFAEIPAWITIR